MPTQEFILKEASGALLGPKMGTRGAEMAARVGGGSRVQGKQTQELWKAPLSFVTNTASRAWKQNGLGRCLGPYKSTPVLEEWRKSVVWKDTWLRNQVHLCLKTEYLATSEACN